MTGLVRIGAAARPSGSKLPRHKKLIAIAGMK